MKKNTTRFIYTGLGFMLVAFAVGCGRADTAPAPVPQETQAIAAEGDLAPKSIFKLEQPKDLAFERASVTMPGLPKEVVKYVAQKPQVVKFKETTLVIPAGSSAGEVSVPIDATDGATVYIGDSADKDTEFYAPGGKTRLNLRAPRVPTPAAVEKAATKLSKVTGANKEATTAPAPVADKPLPVVQLDAKMAHGDYVLKYGAAAGKGGVTLEVRLPMSNIEMDVAPSTLTLLQGDDATVDVELLDGAKGIAGATIEADLVRPDGSSAGSVAVTELGNGKYSVPVSKSLSQTSPVGTWNVFLHAKGTSNGVKFDRRGSTAFAFAIPTAKIATVGAPQLIKDESGKISSFDVAVNLDVASADRYEVSATLVSIGSDGLEHPVAIAQTAEGVTEGRHTFTLHFDAGFVKLTTLEGAFEVRGLQLYSQTRNALYQRHQKGLGLAFPAVRSADLLPLLNPPATVQQLIEDGEFDLRK